MVKNGSKDEYNDMRRQFRKIDMNSQIQLMNGNDTIRDISLWHQSVEAQEALNHPDELQQLINKATALSVLGKRNNTDTSGANAASAHDNEQESNDTGTTIRKAKKGNVTASN